MRHEKIKSDKLLEPALHLEPDEGNDGAEEDHRPAVLITPSPVVFRHVLEVHAIDSRHQGRWDADDRDDGQNLEHVILSYADQTDQGIQDELYFARQLLLVVDQGMDVLAQTGQC